MKIWKNNKQVQLPENPADIPQIISQSEIVDNHP